MFSKFVAKIGWKCRNGAKHWNWAILKRIKKMPKSFSYILHDLPTRYYDTSAPFFQFALPAHSTIHSMYYSVFLKCDYIIIIAKIINEKEKWNFELFPPTTHQSGFTLIGKMMSLKRNKKKLFNSYLLCSFFVRNIVRFPCLLRFRVAC